MSWDGCKMNMESFMDICKFKSHRGLVPLFGCIGAACVLCAASCFRTLAKDPDIMINRQGNPEPWEKQREIPQFAYLNVTGGSKGDCQAPKYWKE